MSDIENTRNTDWLETFTEIDRVAHPERYRPAPAETITRAIVFAINDNETMPLTACGLAGRSAVRSLLTDLREFAHSGAPHDDLVCVIAELFAEAHRS